MLNDKYTPEAHTAETEQYKEFMRKPLEGGQTDPMFNYEKDLDNQNAEDFASNSELDEEKMESESNVRLFFVLV